MLGYKAFIKSLIILSALFFVVVVFELGIFISRQYHVEQINSIKASNTQQIQQFDKTIEELFSEVNTKENEIRTLSGSKEELDSKISELNEQIAGLNINRNNQYPFVVPSTGTVGSQISTYLNVDNYGTHYGVDFWTSTQNGGAISTHKGNPVYSACSGVVESFQPDNGGVTIKCYAIPSSYGLPTRVYTYYGHMGNAVTKEQYIYLKAGQKVFKGQFIGYQGDLSMFTPGMRNVHLHFSVFTGFKEKDGSQDPCKYIGGDCKKVGEFFVSEFNN